MRVLSVSTYPVKAAATRFRLAQFVEPLARSGIELDIAPFLTSSQFEGLYRHRRSFASIFDMLGSIVRRVGLFRRIRDYDLLLVQREAMFFGPAIFEWLYQLVGRMPMVLDLDDATYVKYVSPRYGRFGSLFKFFGKADNLIDRSEMVLCGNRFIAEYVEARGSMALVLPTVVDLDIFRPVERTHRVPVVGWIGTHSTFQFLEPLFPVFKRLANEYDFRLRIIGSGRNDLVVEGVEIEFEEWRLESEVADFQSLDIGLYPILSTGSLDPEWLAGKSGFKAIQYMAVGIPFVMSPVGVCAEIGVDGETHFNAGSDDDWYTLLKRLIDDQTLRETMGAAGRRHAIENYGLDENAAILADALASVAGAAKRKG